MKINKEKEALLTQNKLRSLLEYNLTTGEFVWITSPSKYHSNKVGKVAGGLDKHGYNRIKIGGFTYKTHRLVWLYVYGHFPDGDSWQIDHLDGDRSNNRVENLRVVSPTENQRNKQITSKNTSGITGVCRFKVQRSSGNVDWYWSTTWRDVTGKPKGKRFNIRIYGEEEAKQMAISCRAKQIALLEAEHGIYYTDRHGVKNN